MQDELTSDFFVILRGLVAIVEDFGDEEKIVAVHGLPNLKRRVRLGPSGSPLPSRDGAVGALRSVEPPQRLPP
jgi:hypothetical protein